MSPHLFGEIAQHQIEGVGRGLAQTADGGVAHHLRQLGQQRRVPHRLRHQRSGLGRAHAAGRALAAGFVLEEAHHVARRVHGAVPVRGAAREHHHRSRADEAAVRLQGVEIQRHVGQRRREDAARRPTGQEGVQLMALGQATAVLVHQLAQRDAGGRQLHARLAHPAADAEAPQALAPVAALGNRTWRQAFL